MKKECQKCGRKFNCQEDCWCRRVSLVELPPEGDCLCPVCLVDKDKMRAVKMIRKRRKEV